MNDFSDLKEKAVTPAYREAYQIYSEKLANSSHRNLQNVFTPFSLCYDIIRKLDSYCDGFKDKTFCVFNLEFLETLCYDFGVASEQIWFITDSEHKKAFAEKERYSGVHVELRDYVEFLKEEWDMKFDVIAGNPPYQKLQEGNKKSQAVWHLFVEKSFELCKEDGYVCLIHPSLWRKPNNKTGKIILSKNIKYLEIHNEKDGLKTFNAETRYDWYITQNCISNKPSNYVGQNGIASKLRLDNIPFVPNSDIDEVMSLVAKDGEEKVELLWDCTYHTQTRSKDETMSPVKSNKFKHPCVYVVNSKGEPQLWYSSKREQFFSKQKIVISNGRISSANYYIDENGEYGLTQFSFGIVDSIENLKKIYVAMRSKRFKYLMECCSMSLLQIDKDIMRTFRKDFWKEFVDENGNEIA